MLNYLSQWMYRFDDSAVQKVLLIGTVVLIVSILLGSVVAFLRRRRDDYDGTWPAMITGALSAVLKVLVGLAVVAAMCAHMGFNADEFRRMRGGVSQRNYEAVKTIWGRPHVQEEMTVRLGYYTTHYYDKDGMETDAERLRAASEIVGYREQKTEHVYDANPIVEAHHTFNVVANPRSKGGAEYPGFDTDCSFEYRVVNYTGRDVHAKFSFPLPQDQGLVNRFGVTTDGLPLLAPLVITRSSATWEMDMKPTQTAVIRVSYQSRGLDHFRFRPGAGKRLQKYRVTMNCRGKAAGAAITAADLNYPIGCMTPTSIEKIDNGLRLGWALDEAVTRLGMGFIMPDTRQDGYYVARVLAAAPWGLVLLLIGVLVTHGLTRTPVRVVPLGMLAVAYHLYYLLMAHLGDYAPGLAGGMIIAGAVATVLVALLQLCCNRGPCGWAGLLLFVFFCAVYPAIRLSDYSDLLLAILHVAMLAYAVVLLVLVRRRHIRAAAPATED